MSSISSSTQNQAFLRPVTPDERNKEVWNKVLPSVTSKKYDVALYEVLNEFGGFDNRTGDPVVIDIMMESVRQEKSLKDVKYLHSYYLAGRGFSTEYYGGACNTNPIAIIGDEWTSLNYASFLQKIADGLVANSFYEETLEFVYETPDWAKVIDEAKIKRDHCCKSDVTLKPEWLKHSFIKAIIETQSVDKALFNSKASPSFQKDLKAASQLLSTKAS